jgi:hypothetical protein
LREKYKTEFASRDAAVRAGLAHTLREQADKENDSIAKFVLLREARELAVDGGDFSYSLDVIDDMAKTYQIDVNEMKATALAGGVDRARLSRGELAQNYLKVTDEAINAWDLYIALKAVYLAEKESAGNPEFLAEAKGREKIARVRSHEVTLATQAAQKLARNPENPEQNLILGRHLCFNRKNWEVGLPYLAKCGISALKEIAQKEQANPTDAGTMSALADAWWEFNDPKAGLLAGSARARAAYWYAKALPGLSGEKKDEAEKRIAEAGPQPTQ